MRDLLDHRLAELQRRRRWARVLERALPAALVSLSLGALAVVVIRMALPQVSEWVWAVVSCSLVLPWLLAPRWFRPVDAPARLAGQLDSVVGANGVVMALAATPPQQRDADWVESVRTRLEVVHWPKASWPLLWPVVTVALLSAALTQLPQRVPASAPPSPWVTVMNQADQDLRNLAERGLINQAEQQRLAEQLQRLRAVAQEQGLVNRVWEGLDRATREQNAQAAASARALAATLAKAEDLAPRALQMDAASQQQALAELARQLAELQQQAPGLTPQLGELDPSDRQALTQALQGALAQMPPGALSAQQLAALRQLGLQPQLGQAGQPMPALDPQQLQGAAERLAQRLGQCRSRLGGFDGDFQRAFLLFQRPANGGVNRGPGHVPLQFSHQGQAEAGAVEGLPPGARLNADGSVTLAESRRAADVDQAALADLQRAQQQHFDPAAADGRSASIAPRHRHAVASYFAASEDPPPASEMGVQPPTASGSEPGIGGSGPDVPAASALEELP